MVGAVARQDRLDRGAHPLPVANDEAQRVAQLHRQRVGRRIGQQPLELGDGGTGLARQHGLQRGDEGALPRVRSLPQLTGAVQRGLRHLQQFAPPEKRIEKPLDRMGGGVVRGHLQQLA